MYVAQLENSGGEVLTLTQNEPKWQILSITGLNPPAAQINTTNIAGMDGAKFNSSKLNTRNIVITMRINGDVESNRQEIYRYARTKERCVFYYSNQTRNVSVEGYIDTVECDLFSRSEIVQISIICPYPYFKAIADILVDISNQTALFSFPFSINLGNPIPFSCYQSNRITNVPNRSESATGVVIEVDVLADIEKIQIKNTDTGESITLEYQFLAGDRVVISTTPGDKKITLLRAGERINIFSALQAGSTFFQLQIGDNRFGYLIDNGTHDEDVLIIFNYFYLYRGV